METINLRVTDKVILQAEDYESQKQIAITSPTESLRAKFIDANSEEPLQIKIANAFTLQLGDNGAIWGVHNKDTNDFDNLYNLLTEHPDTEFQFICCVDE